MSRENVLVDGDWLEQHLDDPGLVVVEVDENSADYYAGHIRRAVALDWRSDLQHPLRRDVVDREGFGALLSAKGIGNDDTVVLYGGNNNWFAAYAYWYFKLYGHREVRLLDGGRKRWELDGRSMTAVIDDRPETNYVAAEPDVSIRAFRDDVIDAVGVTNILDVRSPGEFAGELLAPAAFPQELPQVPGHVPTAVNVPWSKAASDDGTFLPDEQLRALYAEAGLQLDGRDTIVYCRIGERSAHTWFVLHELLELSSVWNYDGSWVEYGSLVGAPVER